MSGPTPRLHHRVAAYDVGSGWANAVCTVERVEEGLWKSEGVDLGKLGLVSRFTVRVGHTGSVKDLCRVVSVELDSVQTRVRAEVPTCRKEGFLVEKEVPRVGLCVGLG